METMELIKLLLPLIILQMVLTIFALISCIKAERTKGPKVVWILVILCVSIFGPVLYFVIGKDRT